MKRGGEAILAELSCFTIIKDTEVRKVMRSDAYHHYSLSDWAASTYIGRVAIPQIVMQ